MKRFSLAALFLLIGSHVLHGQQTQSCTKYWLDLLAHGKAACNKQGFIAGTLQGVDCFSTTMDGLPTCCNAKCPSMPHDSVDCDNANGDPRKCTVEPDEEEIWKPEPMGKDGMSRSVIRHVTHAVGRPYHQRCINGGIEAELTDDGFLRCEDTFTNKKTGAECKVNPDSQRGFVCKQTK